MYGGLFFGSLFYLGKHIHNMQSFWLFVLNSIIVSGTTLIYQKLKKQNEQDLMMPVMQGSSTSLFYFTFYAILRSDIIILKFLPIWLFPVFIGFYELAQLQLEIRELKEETNISHLGNLVSILAASIYSIYFKRYKNILDL